MPFRAITSFVDPHASFALKFDAAGAMPAAAEQPTRQDAQPRAARRPRRGGQPPRREGRGDGGGRLARRLPQEERLSETPGRRCRGKPSVVLLDPPFARRSTDGRDGQANDDEDAHGDRFVRSPGSAGGQILGRADRALADEFPHRHGDDAGAADPRLRHHQARRGARPTRISASSSRASPTRSRRPRRR